MLNISSGVTIMRRIVLKSTKTILKTGIVQTIVEDWQASTLLVYLTKSAEWYSTGGSLSSHTLTLTAL